MRSSRLLRLALPLTLVAVLAACAEDSGPQTAPAPPVAAVDTSTPTPTPTATPTRDPSLPELHIEIKDFAFSPAVLQAKPGQAITVTNRDFVAHTLTAKDRSIDSGDIVQDQSWTFIAPGPGTIPYFCEPHPQMTGTLEIS
jgi:plastocyanin